jgi:hypothetical protein
VTPTLRARNAADPEGDALQYTFEVRVGEPSGEVVATGSAPEGTDGETTWVVPDTDALPRGEVYYWTARATDGSLTSPASSPAAFAVFKNSGGGGGAGGCGVAGSARGSAATLLLAVALGLITAGRSNVAEN